MALPTRRQPRRVLTASATRLGPREATQYSKRLTMPWQYRALAHFDLIGELHFACHFIARQISRCRFYPAMLREDGTTEPIESGPPVDILNRIQDPGGGRSQLQYDFGRMMFITGEGTLFGYDLDADFQRWKFLWKDEVRILDDGTAVRLDYQGQPTKQVGVGYRFWTPSPRHSDLADSPLRAVADVAEELIALTAAVRSTAVTRLTNGVIVMPMEAIPNPADIQGDEDPENNPFLDDFIQHVSGQIESPGTAEASVPFLYTPPAEYASEDFFRWVKTHDPATDYMEKDLRVEAINRLALGLDMPPEALKGLGDVNHWGAKAVQLDMWRAHGVNKADQFAESLADAYLRPALEDEEYPDWARVIIEHDDSQVVISPDRTDDALKAQTQGIINNKAAREALGWTDEDALEGEEKDEFFALKLREPSLIDGIALPARGPIPANNGNADASQGPPEPTGGRSGSRQEAMTASVLGGAEAALMRCRKLAGLRIRRKCAECAPGSPEFLVASVVGPDVALDPMKLVEGGTEDYEALLVEKGVDATQARSLCQMIEIYAAKTLFEPRQPDLPAGFMAQVEKAKEVSSVYAD